jgi:uncharacterized protein with PQ loop repeat
MKFQIATLCVGMALWLDTLSYYKQIKKTIKTKRSSQVSSSSFLYKIAKVVFSMVGLVIYSNFVGFWMELFMLLVYSVSLAVIIKYKPKNWSLWR